MCLAINTQLQKLKFEERAFKIIFWSFASRFKAFKLYKLKIKKILVSRDVVFHVSVFPYHTHNTDSLPTITHIPISIPEQEPSTHLNTHSIHKYLTHHHKNTQIPYKHWTHQDQFIVKQK